MTPNSATPTSATTTLETVKARILKNESGIIGSSVRLSQSTKSAPSTIAPPMKASVYAPSQAWLAVLIRPQVSEKRLALISTVPTMSSERADGSLDSITAHAVTPSAITPIGTFTQNTADQEKCWVRKPPSSG